MKYILLADSHFGVRQNRSEYHDNMKLFYDKVFFPYLEENPGMNIIHLGDVFDDRRRIDTLTIKRAREYFFEPVVKYLTQHNKKMYIIAGNHDLRFRDSLDVNTLREVIQNNFSHNQDIFKIITEPFQLEKEMLLIPWITKSNRDQVFTYVSTSESDYLLGHLELQGYNYSRVQVATHGELPESFKQFKQVFSGHYHYKHSKGNVTYLGSPTEHTWVDAGTSRGFHVFDSDIGNLTFIQNLYKFHVYVDFGEKLLQDPYPRVFRVYYDGQNIKQSELDKYVEYLYSQQALAVETINKAQPERMIQSNQDTVLESVEDTPTFIKNYVENEELSTIMINLYNRALSENSST